MAKWQTAPLKSAPSQAPTAQPQARWASAPLKSQRGTVGPDGVPDLLRRPADQMPSNEPQYGLDGTPYIPRFHEAPKPAMEATQPNKPWNEKAADWISDTLVPAAERTGTSLGGMVMGARPGAPVAGEVGRATGEGLANWTGTVLKDPMEGTRQAVDLLEPTHQIAGGWNDLGYALGELFKGDTDAARASYMEATPKLLMGTAGILPGGSMTASALTKGASKGPSIGSQIFKPGPTPLDRAADILIKKMKADGLTLDDLQATAGSLARRGDSGVYETLSEVAGLSGKSSGANLRGLAMALGAVPGPAQEALIRRVMENAEKLPQRTSRAASRATGQDASKTAATLDELEMRLRTESKPRYDAAYDTPIDPQVFERQIKPVLETAQGKQAARAALSGLKGIEADLTAKVASGNSDAGAELARVKASVASLQQGIPTTQALDHVKRAYDNLISRAGQDSYSAGLMRSTKRNLAESVSQGTGGKYGEALGFYEQGSRLQEAFDIGLNALKQPTWQLERSMKAGNKGSPFSKGEIEAIALGVARHIDDLVEANDQSALTRLSKGKALKNIETALGDPKAAKAFEQSVKRLMANREWGRRIGGGSDTAMRREAVRDATAGEEDVVTRAIDRVETSSAPPTLLGLAWSGLAKPAAKAGKDAYRRFRYPGIYDEGVNEALAPLMSSPMTKGEVGKLTQAVEARLTKGKPAMMGPPKPKQVAGPPKAGAKKQGFGGDGFIRENIAAAGIGSVGGSMMDQEDPGRGALIGMMAGLGGRAALRMLPKTKAIAGETAGLGPRDPKGPKPPSQSSGKGGQGEALGPPGATTGTQVPVGRGGQTLDIPAVLQRAKIEGMDEAAKTKIARKFIDMSPRERRAIAEKVGIPFTNYHDMSEKILKLIMDIEAIPTPIANLPTAQREAVLKAAQESFENRFKPTTPSQSSTPPGRTTQLRPSPVGEGQRVHITDITAPDGSKQAFGGTLNVDPQEGLAFHPNYPTNTWNELGDSLAKAAGKTPDSLKRMIKPEAGIPGVFKMKVSRAEDGAKWSDANIGQIGPEHAAQLDEAIRERFIGLVKSNPGARKYSLEIDPSVTSKETNKALAALARDTDHVFVEVPDDSISLVSREAYNENWGRYRHGNVKYDKPGSPPIGAPSPPGSGKGPPKPKGPPQNPAVKEALDHVARENIAKLVRDRKTASGDNLAAIDAQIAAIRGTREKPGKPPPPVLSAETQDLDRQIAAAERRFAGARRKWGRFPDQRDPIYQVHIDEIADLKRQRAESFARDERGRGMQKIGRKAVNAARKTVYSDMLNDPKVPIAGLGLGAAAAVGVAAISNRNAPPEERKGPPTSAKVADPRVRTDWASDRVKKPRLVQAVQTWLNDVDPTYRLNPDGKWAEGGETDQAIKFWQQSQDPPFDPDGILTDEQLDLLYSQATEAKRGASPREAILEAQ